MKDSATQRRGASARSHGHLDPHAPLVLDIRELGRRPGSLRRVSRGAPAPADLGTPLLGVAPGAELAMELRLESVVEGVLVTGTVVAPLRGECGRCLDPVATELGVTFQELYVADAVEAAEAGLGLLEGDLLDLEPAVRDAIVLELPLTPLCSPDCIGLCAQCGARLADEPGHTHDQDDPRWDALRRLASQHEED